MTDHTITPAALRYLANDFICNADHPTHRERLKGVVRTALENAAAALEPFRWLAVDKYPFPPNRDEGTGPRVLASDAFGHRWIAHFDAGDWYGDGVDRACRTPAYFMLLPEFQKP
jgi:hypothetical protein